MIGMPPTFRNTERWIFRRSLKNVSFKQRKIAIIYKQTQERILEQIAKYRMLGEIPFTVKEIRLRNLYNEIDKQIKAMGIKTTGYINSGFKANYEETYYRTAYNLERQINIGKGFEYLKADYSFNYPLLSDEAVKAAMSKDIAGHTFLERSLRDQRVLQWKVRQEVAGAITEGTSTTELSKKLGNVKDAFRSNKVRAQATARTEMLRAYSVGQSQADEQAEMAGVENEYTWSATLDEKTRPSHGAMDGKEAEYDEDGNKFYNVNGVLLTAPRIEAPNNTKGAAGEIVNCRCSENANPFGFKATKRVAKMTSGKWYELNGDITYEKWKKTRTGKDTIKVGQEEKRRKALARRRKKTKAA